VNFVREKEKLKKKKKTIPSTVIDASGLVLGRLASHVAKGILIGEDIVIINAEKAIITGNKENILNEFQTRLGTKTWGSQKKAPKHPRRPDTYLRRVVRGMLPWKKPRGKKAYSKLKVYIGIPEKYKEVMTTTFSDANKNIRPYMTVGELLQIYGWQPPSG
jgi:large subunit ribosomal protein L13